MNIYVSQELENEVVRFTDAGEWKHSWHWDRDRTKAWSPITIKGAEQMLRDLQCDGSMDAEIDAMTRRIRSRYDVANRLRALIDKARVFEVADSHEDGCECDYCVAAGYVNAARAAGGDS